MYKVNEEKYIKEWEIKRKPYATVSWENKSVSSPIGDLRAWQKILGDICGIYGNIIEFNNRVFISLCESEEHNRLEYKKIVSPSDLIDLLWSKVEPIINNDLEDGKVIIKSSGEFLPKWYKDMEVTVY